jgi:hypothetical protein
MPKTEINKLKISPSLLIENYAWVDERIFQMFYIYALTYSNYDEFEKQGFLTEKYDWVDKQLYQKTK